MNENFRLHFIYLYEPVVPHGLFKILSDNLLSSLANGNDHFDSHIVLNGKSPFFASSSIPVDHNDALLWRWNAETSLRQDHLAFVPGGRLLVDRLISSNLPTRLNLLCNAEFIVRRLRCTKRIPMGSNIFWINCAWVSIFSRVTTIKRSKKSVKSFKLLTGKNEQ